MKKCLRDGRHREILIEVLENLFEEIFARNVSGSENSFRLHANIECLFFKLTGSLFSLIYYDGIKT